MADGDATQYSIIKAMDVFEFFTLLEVDTEQKKKKIEQTKRK
jgi:hypothetical protein